MQINTKEDVIIWLMFGDGFVTFREEKQAEVRKLVNEKLKSMYNKGWDVVSLTQRVK
jgi:ArsR family metal-binding transcriptional regulator